MAGDSMLKEVALQLASVMPPTATLGRLGGDEFGCLLPDTDESAALHVAEDVHAATARYRFHFGQNDFGVTASIGITIFGNAEGDTTDSVLSRADIACYLAKEDGHNETRVYRPADEAMLSWHAAIQEVSQVEQALSNGKLSLFCQQIVAIGKRVDDPHLYEVLLRLQEGGRWQSASEFLPLVQRFGLMERIDRWVFEKACEFLASAGDPALRLSINISGATLNQPSFFEFAMAVPERYGVDASRICLEITESVAIQRLRQSVEAMHKLRARGFDIALDDFGAGVASFGYLHELPVSMVKLDGRFVRDLRSDPAAVVIIDSLVRLAELRRVACVAEWVESEESIDQLRRLGVGYAQGYYIGMPKPLHDPAPRTSSAGSPGGCSRTLRERERERREKEEQANGNQYVHQVRRAGHRGRQHRGGTQQGNRSTVVESRLHAADQPNAQRRGGRDGGAGQPFEPHVHEISRRVDERSAEDVLERKADRQGHPELLSLGRRARQSAHPLPAGGHAARDHLQFLGVRRPGRYPGGERLPRLRHR
jgi:EAL domain-containing protein (putative c-di-GMP-specific phosphodiesterase class I)